MRAGSDGNLRPEWPDVPIGENRDAGIGLPSSATVPTALVATTTLT